MIALARNPRCRKSADHAKYLTMLPAIAHYASAAFRHLDAEAREDAVTEVIANTFVAYARLAELGKTHVAYPTVLALYEIRQYWDGRRVGTKANCRDVYRSGLRRQHLGTSRDKQWQEALIDNTRSPVPDQASFRIDFPDWLESLTARDRDEESGRIAVAEGNGAMPDKLAKGVLWLNPNKPITLDARWSCYLVMFAPVISARTDEPRLIAINVNELTYLTREHGMRLWIVGENGEMMEVKPVVPRKETRPRPIGGAP